MGSSPLVSANIEVANLKQDLELIAREVAGLRTEVEMLRRENAQLRVSLQQVSKNASNRTGDSQGLLVQIDSRVRKLESRIAANEKNTASLQSSFDLKIQDLVNKMNQNFAKVSVPTPSSPPVLISLAIILKTVLFIKWKKEKRLAVLPKNISPKSNGLSMPIRLLTLPR